MKTYLIPSTLVESFKTGFLMVNETSVQGGGAGLGTGPGSGHPGAPRHDDYRPIN